MSNLASWMRGAADFSPDSGELSETARLWARAFCRKFWSRNCHRPRSARPWPNWSAPAAICPACVCGTPADTKRLAIVYRRPVAGQRTNGGRTDIIAPDTQADLGAEQLLKQAVDSLSGLSQCAGLVLSPGADPIIKHIEFTPISDDQILVILVDEANQVENRVIPKPRDLLPSTLTEVSNYLNARLKGRTLEELRREAQSELEHLRTELGELTAQIVAAGLALGRTRRRRAPSQEALAKSLIVRGEAHLLNNIGAMEDLERVRLLFEDLERKEELITSCQRPRAARACVFSSARKRRCFRCRARR